MHGRRLDLLFRYREISGDAMSYLVMPCHGRETAILHHKALQGLDDLHHKNRCLMSFMFCNIQCVQLA